MKQQANNKTASEDEAQMQATRDGRTEMARDAQMNTTRDDVAQVMA